MNRFNNILYVSEGASGEKAGLEKTIALAKLVKAKVTVMDVLEDTIESFPVTEGTANMARLQRDLVKVRTEELKKLVKSAMPGSLKMAIPVKIRQGKDFIEIVRAVQQDGYDLVVKTSGRPHLTGMLFSTLDMNLVRKCPCPVLILKPRKKLDHSRILASLDLRTKVKSPKNMDHTIMELAGTLAKLEKGTLHILHAWHVAFEKRLKNRKSVAAAYKSMQTMLRDMRKMEKAHLDEMAEAYALTPSETHLIKGEPEIVIPRFVKNHRIDLVVMGTIGRSGIKGFFIGNTAEKVLNSINCSVLCIKPPGWRSPVS